MYGTLVSCTVQSQVIGLKASRKRLMFDPTVRHNSVNASVPAQDQNTDTETQAHLSFFSAA